VISVVKIKTQLVAVESIHQKAGFTERSPALERIIIEGGNPLHGEVHISGAKNAALPVLVTTLLSSGESIIANVPRLRDVATISRLLELLGAKADFRDQHTMVIDTSGVSPCRIPYDLVKTMRASVLVLGPLLARFGEAEVSLPGGCAIGARPINLHLKGLMKLGVKIDLVKGYVKAKCEKMHGGHIVLDLPTVTGTENLMMTAAMIDDETVIDNAAREPEVSDLAEVLKKMGASIDGAGTDHLIIHGNTRLKPFQHRIIPDRIEAGTFMVAAAIVGGKVCIKNCPFEYLSAVGEKIEDAGITINEISPDVTEIVRRERDSILPLEISTAPYPGFPTDMQAQFMALLSLAKGVSLIRETVFENRFMHVQELMRMGADIDIDGHTAVIKGVNYLDGAPVMATDLRASACLIIAGLAARGETVVSRIYHLDRGYEKIEEKFRQLGAIIRREMGK
jgi:UDP-N-acetylglucosamine 1-carboxyvinyltransferase